MTTLFALSLPGLVVILILIGVYQLASSRIRGTKRPGAGSVGLELLDTVLKPGSEHRIQEKESQRLLRDESEEDAPLLDQPLKRITIRLRKNSTSSTLK